MDPEVRERIRRRAYKLWEQEGRPEGRAEAHWFQAELEAHAELAIARLKPGDEAPPGAAGAGEHVRPECGGSGRLGR